MPNSSRQQTVWCPTGNYDTTNISPTDWASLGGQPGQLGIEFEAQNKRYQRVQLDSGVSSSILATAAGQLLYWKSKAGSYIVTNDRRFALGFSGGNDGYRNQVAGILRLATATPGNYIDILKAGDNISVVSDGSGADGGIAVAEAGNAARVVAVTAGTAITVNAVGVIRGAASGGLINVDVDLPDTP